MEYLRRDFIKRHFVRATQATHPRIHTGSSHLHHPLQSKIHPPNKSQQAKPITPELHRSSPSSSGLSRLRRQVRHGGFSQPPPLQVHRSNPIRRTKRLFDQGFSDPSVTKAGGISSPAMVETTITDRPTPLTVEHPYQTIAKPLYSSSTDFQQAPKFHTYVM